MSWQYRKSPDPAGAAGCKPSPPAALSSASPGEAEISLLPGQHLGSPWQRAAHAAVSYLPIWTYLRFLLWGGISVANCILGECCTVDKFLCDLPLPSLHFPLALSYFYSRRDKDGWQPRFAAGVSRRKLTEEKKTPTNKQNNPNSMLNPQTMQLASFSCIRHWRLKKRLRL